MKNTFVALPSSRAIFAAGRCSCDVTSEEGRGRNWEQMNISASGRGMREA